MLRCHIGYGMHCRRLCAECKIECFNCGIIDEKTCTCASCPAGWHGEFCESELLLFFYSPLAVVVTFFRLCYFICYVHCIDLQFCYVTFSVMSKAFDRCAIKNYFFTYLLTYLCERKKDVGAECQHDMRPSV